MTFSGPDEADISLHVRPGCLRPGQLVGTISVERVALLVGCRGEDFLVSEVVDCRPPGTTFERAVDLDFGVGVLGGLEVEQGRKAAVGGRDAMEHRQAIKHHLLETRKARCVLYVCGVHLVVTRDAQWCPGDVCHGIWLR